MKKKIIVVLIMCLFLMDTQAQDSSYISLNKLLKQVEINYPSIIQYQYSMQALQAKTEGAKSWMPPTFSAGIMRFPYNLMMLNEKNDPMNQAGLAFSVEQMIPNKRKLNAKKDYLNSLADIEKSKSDWTKNELSREAKVLYYYRYINEKKQNILRESGELLNLLITTSENRFSNNQSQLQNIYKAKARLAELKNMQFMLLGMIAESNIGLNILMVRDVNISFKIDTLIEAHNYPIIEADTGNISNRSDIMTMSKNIRAMQLEQNLMKVGNRSDFGIRAEHMQMFGMPNQWSVMGMITIPIVPWSSKMYKAETNAIGFQIQAMEQGKQTMELMAKRMLSEKLTMLGYEYGQYKNYKNEIVPAFENSLQANLLAYKQNTGDFFVLLDAWEMLLMKKMEMNDKLFTILKLEAGYEYEMEIK